VHARRPFPSSAPLAPPRSRGPAPAGRTASRARAPQRASLWSALLLAPAGCAAPAADAPPPAAPTAGATHGEPVAANHGHGASKHGGPHGHGHHGGHHRFDNAEQWAAVFDNPERDAWQRGDAVVQWIGLAPTDVVADLGAGTGYFAMRLAKAVPQGKVLANDVEADMVRYLGERAAREQLANVVPVQGTPTDAALPEPADVVFLCDVYHHIAEPSAFFTRLRASMTSDARVVIVDFKPDDTGDVPGPPKEMRVAAATIVATLAPLGFEQVRLDEQLLPHQYVLELRRVR